MKGTKNAATLETLLTSGKMEQDKIADQILEFTLPDTLIAQLEDYARVGHGTPSDILAAVFNLLLSRYTGQTVVTTTYQNHPLQIDCSDDPIFSQLMEQVNVPQPEISALPSIYFIHSRIELATLPTSFALLYDTKNDKLTFAYNLSLFDKTFIQQLADSYQILLSGIVKNPNQEVSQLPILTEAQQRQEFIDWNQTRQPAYPTDKTIHEVFEKQAEKTPQNIAVVYEDEHGGNRVELTYADLNGRSNQLARFIREQYKAKTGYELTPDTFIGVCVDRSVDIIIGKLAILKAGAAYVALDPAYPEERLKVILEDADIKLVLSQTSVLKRLDYLFQDGRTIVSLDADKEQFEKQAIENLPNINKPTDLAYLMYTSGSTGKPKGVMVEHKGVPNMAYAAAHDVLQLEQTDRTLEFASINFDAAAAEIWPPLLIGASLYVLPEALRTDPEGLCDYLERHAITVLQFMPPTMLVMIPRERKLPQIRIMLVAGEKCPEDVMRHWSQGRRLVNAFGPAETTVCSSFSVYHEGVLATQVGLPIANVTNYVLDQHLQPVPVGVTGEYCVGGIGVARGYLKRLEITAQKFVVIEIGGKKN